MFVIVMFYRASTVHDSRSLRDLSVPLKGFPSKFTAVEDNTNVVEERSVGETIGKTMKGNKSITLYNWTSATALPIGMTTNKASASTNDMLQGKLSMIQAVMPVLGPFCETHVVS